MESANKTRLPLTICKLHLQFADSTYNLRFPLATVHSATAQLNETNVLSFVCGFHQLFWVPLVLGSANTVADSANSLIFGAILSNVLFQVNVCRIQNSRKNQKK